MAEDRIARALNIAMHYGGDDGAHHKAWVIDQMVRALTGCPTETRIWQGPNGTVHPYETQGESDEYRQWVAVAKEGKNGPDTYDWDEGIAP